MDKKGPRSTLQRDVKQCNRKPNLKVEKTTQTLIVVVYKSWLWSCDDDKITEAQVG